MSKQDAKREMSSSLWGTNNRTYSRITRPFAYLWNLVIHVIFGIFLVVLSLALYECLKTGSSALIRTATAFG
jgi:hypothetical protein